MNIVLGLGIGLLLIGMGLVIAAGEGTIWHGRGIENRFSTCIRLATFLLGVFCLGVASNMLV